MRLIKASLLARNLGIPRRTVSGWCAKDPALAVKRGHDYFVKIDALATKEGLDPVKAHIIINRRLIKAVELAALARMPRRTLARWCKERPHLAVRIGRIWYVDLESLGCTEEHVEVLRKWAPDKPHTAKLVEICSILAPC